MPKTVNSLMAYIRNEKGIHVSGSAQKKKLRYMGYFHGYKGYRYCREPHILFNFSDFDELQSIYEFDMKIKTIFYPQIMFIETVIKNYALECILDENNSERFADVFSKALTSYKSFDVGTSNYKEHMAKRLKLREHVFSAISREYRRPIVSHYYDLDKPVPIWAIFELLTLGEFGSFVSCMSNPLKIRLSKEIGIKTSFDPDGRIPEMYIFTIKDLRNAIAHNGTVFDTRFKTGKINSRLSTYIKSETGISNITFDTIVDYLLLIVFILKGLQCNRSIIHNFVSDFERSCENLRKQIPIGIYNQILYTDTRNKLTKIKDYIKF